jgi:hypothetical protein
VADQPEEHSDYSPSASNGWTECAAYIVMNEGKPDQGSEYAVEGSAAHLLFAESWNKGINPMDHPAETLLGVPVDAEMRRFITKHTAVVASYGEGKEVHVEQRLPWGVALNLQALGLGEQFGTSDTVIVDEDQDELTVIDLKYGRGHAVSAEENRQLLIYAIGARYDHAVTFAPKRIKLIIHQPRLGRLDEWTCDADYLDRFEKEVFAAVQRSEAARAAAAKGLLTQDYFAPSPEACMWCKAKGNCQALADFNLWCKAKGNCQALADFNPRLIVEEFDDESDRPLEEVFKEAAHEPITGRYGADELGRLMTLAPLIETWLKALRAETERLLFAGEKVPGWKLVQGKQGNRKWTDKDEVEEVMKVMRLARDAMYKISLISPTDAEKLLAEASPKQWKKLEDYITREPGQPSVAPEKDKRPALTFGADVTEFENLDENTEEN